LLSFNAKYFVFPSHTKKLKTKMYKTVILPFVLYRYKAWSLTLREEHRLRVYENSVLRKVFRPKREEDGWWGKFHDYERHSPYSSPNIVKVIKSRSRWVGHMASRVEGRGVSRILVGRPTGKRPLRRPSQWRITF
jgi:hypothetical protein